MAALSLGNGGPRMTDKPTSSDKDDRYQAVLSCLCYTLASVLLTLANKAVFSERRLDYPWLLLSMQSSVVCLLLGGYIILAYRRWPLNLKLLQTLGLPCVAFTLFIYSNARALRYISLPLLSVIKSLSPVGIAGIESMQGIYVSKGTYFAMLLIVLANVVSVYYDVEYQPLGYLWALGNVCFNVVYVTLLRRLDCDASNIEKTLHNNFLLVMLTLPFGVSSGDVLKFAAALAATSTTFKAMYFVSCVLAAAIGATVFWVIQATSGSTLSFVGTSNKILVVALGAILFEVKISPHGWFGIILGVTASICFTVSKAQQEAAASALKSRETPADADNKNEERPVVGDPADDSSEDGVTNDRTHFLRRGVTGS